MYMVRIRDRTYKTGCSSFPMLGSITLSIRLKTTCRITVNYIIIITLLIYKLLLCLNVECYHDITNIMFIFTELITIHIRHMNPYTLYLQCLDVTMTNFPVNAFWVTGGATTYEGNIIRFPP